MSTIVQNPVFTADPTLEWRGRGALGDPESEALSSSASNWSGSALSPRMRKNPAMVAERKMRMTRSGHIFSRLGLGSLPTNEAINPAQQMEGRQETDSRKAAPFGCGLLLVGGGGLAIGEGECCNGGLGEVGLGPGSGWVDVKDPLQQFSCVCPSSRGWSTHAPT